MKPFLLSLLVFILITPFVLADPAGWSNDIRIISGFDDSNEPTLALDSSNNAHVVWTSRTGNNLGIYYQKLTSTGLNLTPQILISNIEYSPESPSIAIDNNNDIHIVWSDVRLGDLRVFYKKFNNDGLNLTSDIQASYSYSAYYPVVAVDNNENVHIVWQDDDHLNSTERIFYRKLDNNGQNLTADIALTPHGEEHSEPSFTVDHSGNVHVVWHNINGIFYKKLDNNGINLTDIIHLYNQPAAYPVIITDIDNNAHIVWSRGRTQTMDYIKLDNHAANLTPITSLTSSSAYFPSITIDSINNIHISFMTGRNIHYMKINSDGNILLPNTQITLNPNTYAITSSIAIDTYGNAHIVWDDQPDIYYKHSLPPQFTIQGQSRIGNTISITLSDPLNPNTPYILLMSLSNNTGIPLGDGRKIPLDYDGLFEAALFFPQYIGLNNAQGMLDQNGNAVITWAIPNEPALVGLNLYVNYVTVYPERQIPQLINSIADAEKITLY